MFLLRRLGLMIVTLWIVSLIVFFAGQILPGDPGRAILGPFAAKSAVQTLDTQLGVNRPLITRYVSWIGGLLRGNMGTSYSYRTAVEPFIRAALINSVKLAVLAFVIVVPLGIIGGVIAALYGGRAVDRIISVTGLSLATVPEFVSGIVLIVVFGVTLKVLPVTASAGAGAGGFRSGPDHFRDRTVARYRARVRVRDRADRRVRRNAEGTAGDRVGRGGRRRPHPVSAFDFAGYTARFRSIRLHCPYGQGRDHR